MLLVSISQQEILNDDHSPTCFTCLRKFCPYIGFQPAATTEKNKTGSSDSNLFYSCVKRWYYQLQSHRPHWHLVANLLTGHLTVLCQHSKCMRYWIYNVLIQETICAHQISSLWLLSQWRIYFRGLKGQRTWTVFCSRDLKTQILLCNSVLCRNWRCVCVLWLFLWKGK